MMICLCLRKIRGWYCCGVIVAPESRWNRAQDGHVPPILIWRNCIGIYVVSFDRNSFTIFTFGSTPTSQDVFVKNWIDCKPVFFFASEFNKYVAWAYSKSDDGPGQVWCVGNLGKWADRSDWEKVPKTEAANLFYLNSTFLSCSFTRLQYSTCQFVEMLLR